MAQLISLSIDVSKITKSKIKDGKWLNLTISVNNEVNEYGKNVSLYEEQTKEERESKAKRTYIGSGKVVWSDGQDPVIVSSSGTPMSNKKKVDTEELPF